MAPIKTYIAKTKKMMAKKNSISQIKSARKAKRKIVPSVTESLERAILSCESFHDSNEDSFDNIIRLCQGKKFNEFSNKEEKNSGPKSRPKDFLYTSTPTCTPSTCRTKRGVIQRCLPFESVESQEFDKSYIDKQKEVAAQENPQSESESMIRAYFMYKSLDVSTEDTFDKVLREYREEILEAKRSKKEPNNKEEKKSVLSVTQTPQHKHNTNIDCCSIIMIDDGEVIVESSEIEKSLFNSNLMNSKSQSKNHSLSKDVFLDSSSMHSLNQNQHSSNSYFLRSKSSMESEEVIQFDNINLTQNDREMLASIKFGETTSNSNSLFQNSLPETAHSLIPNESEESDKIESDVNMKEAIVNLPILEEKLILKPGKQWRRSLLRQTHGVNVNQRRMTIISIINEDLEELSDVISISPENSIRVEEQEDFEEVFQRTVNLQDDEAKENLDPNVEKLGKEKGLKKTLPQERESFFGYAKDSSAKELILQKCEQQEILDFRECYPESSLKNCHKIAEGVYGEVFLLKKSPTEVSVLKIIPIEGSYNVNGVPQMKFKDVLSEIIIQSELSSLRDDENNQTATFSQLKKISCVRGEYPDRLIELWELFEEVNGTENDHPEIFKNNQIFIVLELENAGQDLEKFMFYNVKQAWSVFKQIVCGLAVAESSLEFEHRDLHWGNVLIKNCNEPKDCERYLLDGDEILIQNNGVKATIIDYTLSRIKKNGVCMFIDLKDDEDLFKGKGDYQFDIYRLMKKSNRNHWEKFDPYSNVLWLHYILGKMLNGVHYRCEKTRLHFNGITAMKELHKVLLNYKTVKEILNDVKQI